MKIIRSLLLLFCFLSFLSVRAQEYRVVFDSCKTQYWGGGNYFINVKRISHCLIGLQPPDFTAVSLEGDTIRRADLQGKVSLLNFWFMNCKPCLIELPYLKQLVDSLEGEEFVLLGFSSDPEAALRRMEFPTIHGMNFPVLPMPRPFFNDTFAIMGFPTNMLLDRQGRIVQLEVGGATEPEEAEEVFRDLYATIRRLLEKE